jgi:hypothetical protein
VEYGLLAICRYIIWFFITFINWIIYKCIVRKTNQ